MSSETPLNKLDQLRTMTDVVADTGDIEAIAKYRPVDATTNPSLLLKAAALSQYSNLIDETAATVAQLNLPSSDEVDMLADRYAVAIGCEILKIVPGRISTEVDAQLSFDRDASVARAHRLIELYAENDIRPDRVLIKLASTWEGIEAARILEAQGINCNLTLLFCDVQAVAAAKAGAFLISPFVGRILDWHRKAAGVDSYPADEDPGVKSVRNIYSLFKDKGYETIVMGASFRNAGEIEALAGCDRLTIGPDFLEELAQDEGSLPQCLKSTKGQQYVDCDFLDESDFRLQLNADAMATEKLAEGIRGFVKDQITLNALLKDRLPS